MANVLEDLKRNYKAGDVVQKLIFWNVGASVVLLLLEALLSSVYGFLFSWIALSDGLGTFFFKPWTIITYSFIHAGIVHLLLNMIVLYFVGQLFYTFFKGKQFLATYMMGALFGGLFFLVGAVVFNVGEFLVGASAAIIAPLIALVAFQPQMQVRLMLIGTVKIWYIAAFIIIIDIIQLSGSNIGGHLAHLGGAFAGGLYVYLLRRNIDVSDVFNFKFEKKAKVHKSKMSKVYSRAKSTSSSTRSTTFTKEGQNDPKQELRQIKIDAILDKISKSGYESLTQEEKQFLFQSGKEL